MTGQPRRKFYGWGLEGEGLDQSELAELDRRLAAHFKVGELPRLSRPRLEEIELRAPRVMPPAALRSKLTGDPYERVLHTYGKSLPDTIRALARSFPDPPDWVAYPASEAELAELLDWAAETNVAAIPFGGGSSVCGGVEPAVGDSYAGTISLDLTRLDRVLEVDPQSLSARIQAGIRGPALEARLREHDLTLRHFPQSFEHSTLGGWIATRSGGHFATLYTHIDDLVESLRVVTPAGVVESRRLPGSGAGPSPDRLFIGSEGGLGVITEAWMRVRRRPRFRAAATARFSDFLAGAEAVRALAQSGLHPSNCRLIDAAEAAAAGSEGEGALLVLGFESADHPVATAMARALELVSDHGGAAEYDAGAGSSAGARSGAAGSWRRSFLRAPYYREELTRRAVIADTFETAITWDRFEALYRGVTERMLHAIAAATGRPGTITCRFTHVYPDGPAPYFSFRALGGTDSMLDQWREIKAAANAAVVELGGTVTHHHAVGRDHRPGYQRQCPPLFAEALRAVKRTLDPAGILNPGVLIDPDDRPVGVTGAMRAGAMRAE